MVLQPFDKWVVGCPSGMPCHMGADCCSGNNCQKEPSTGNQLCGQLVLCVPDWGICELDSDCCCGSCQDDGTGSMVCLGIPH